MPGRLRTARARQSARGLPSSLALIRSAPQSTRFKPSFELATSTPTPLQIAHKCQSGRRKPSSRQTSSSPNLGYMSHRVRSSFTSTARPKVAREEAWYHQAAYSVLNDRLLPGGTRYRLVAGRPRGECRPAPTSSRGWATPVRVGIPYP